MGKINERIKELREKSGIKQKELAEKLKVSATIISAYEKGKRMPSRKMVEKIAKFFNVSTDYLLGNTDDPTLSSLKEIVKSFIGESKQKEKHLEKLKLRLVAVYDGANAGKTGIFPNDTVIQSFATIPIDSPGSYGVIVHGDSMEPAISDGDIVIVDPNQDVPNGKKGVVFVDGGVLIKRIYRHNDSVSLVSDNPEYPPIVIKSSELPVYLLGKVVFVLKREK